MEQGLRLFHKAVEHEGALFDIDVVCAGVGGEVWEWSMYALVPHPTQAGGSIFYYTHVPIKGPVQFKPDPPEPHTGVKGIEAIADLGFDLAEQWLRTHDDEWRARLPGGAS